MPELITLNRLVDAIQIPEGTKMILPEGLRVQIMQTLGGSFTVTTENGYMCRIEGKNADALGKEPPVEPEAVAALKGGAGGDLEAAVWEQLKTVFDPEIPVNIVDLGLVYECAIKKHKSGDKVVTLKMTMTAPGCGMGDVLKADAQAKIHDLPGIADVSIDIVFEPPWDQSMMSEAARLELGMM